MSSDVDFDFDVPEVIAVREDTGQPPELINHKFQLAIRYSSPALVLFRLIYSINGASTNTTIYLQIRVDCIESLEKKTYGNSDNNTPSPPYFETVRQRLNGIRSVARLKFQLYGGRNVQLIVPFDFTIGKVYADQVCDTHGSPKSLAAASLFSLYFRHDLLTNKQFGKYKWAIRQFPLLTETEKQRYECMADVGRLYVGARGKVLKENEESSPPAREHCISPTPTTPLSCGSTVPFDTEPHRRGSPPPYVACLGEDRLPRATFAAIFADSLGDDRDPPKYGNTERLLNVLDPAEGVHPCENEEITDIQLTPKRKRSSASGHTTRTSSAEALRPEKLQRPLLGDWSRVMCMLEKQQQQIDQLQRTLGESRGQNEVLENQNKALQRRCDDLEARCSELEHRQDNIVGDIDNLDVEVDELQARCDTLEKQMPDICDDMEERKGQIVEEFKKNIGESIEDAIANSVDAEVSEVKRRICEALRPI
ncbi:hypothetical protein LZ30DRAFT_734675 [Colletotrichum cereale]|nr:hypothetical protein LZ30DRAFT_734675 [Colletotrichum cereale]